MQPFQQLGEALISPLPPDVRADLGATFRWGKTVECSKDFEKGAKLVSYQQL